MQFHSSSDSFIGVKCVLPDSLKPSFLYNGFPISDADSSSNDRSLFFASSISSLKADDA
jgi:hypothetical protein